jgi:hypothetical protein
MLINQVSSLYKPLDRQLESIEETNQEYQSHEPKSPLDLAREFPQEHNKDLDFLIQE